MPNCLPCHLPPLVELAARYRCPRCPAAPLLRCHTSRRRGPGRRLVRFLRCRACVYRCKVVAPAEWAPPPRPTA